jgi:hypothetical protein
MESPKLNGAPRGYLVYSKTLPLLPVTFAKVQRLCTLRTYACKGSVLALAVVTLIVIWA